MKKFIIFLSIAALFFSWQWQNAKAGEDATFYQNAADFAYKFPAMIQNKTGRLCTYGYDQVITLLENNHNTEVVFFRDGHLKDFEHKNCKVLYISKNMGKDYLAIEIANRFRVVSISLDEEFLDNGGLFLMQMGRRNFELVANKNKMKLYDIKFDYMASNLIVN